ncbi:hypothetical protein Vadar_014342 [Vaccinium darrowii]|uniref:Uncharacterized protein n=1 Tax=Vaccinium darrowii TaxID=229202 RepID=A0ACB7ZKM4_9ERIC|nr:hypothetical protein Vadar_014342 [Vaccinium darrowii]
MQAAMAATVATCSDDVVSVSTEFSSLIRHTCCKTKCSFTIPSVVSDPLSPSSSLLLHPSRRLCYGHSASGETYILYNQQTKGNERELIQLGAPIFGHIREEGTGKDEDGHIEPIPTLLQGVTDHLIQWHLISENRKPSSCIINQTISLSTLITRILLYYYIIITVYIGYGKNGVPACHVNLKLDFSTGEEKDQIQHCLHSLKCAICSLEDLNIVKHGKGPRFRVVGSLGTIWIGTKKGVSN